MHEFWNGRWNFQYFQINTFKNIVDDFFGQQIPKINLENSMLKTKQVVVIEFFIGYVPHEKNFYIKKLPTIEL